MINVTRLTLAQWKHALTKTRLISLKSIHEVQSDNTSHHALFNVILCCVLLYGLTHRFMYKHNDWIHLYDFLKHL